jgi:hypothetical protein
MRPRVAEKKRNLEPVAFRQAEPVCVEPQEPECGSLQNDPDELPFPDCPDFDAQGGCQPVLHQRYEGNRGDILRCKTCGRTYSSRRGGILFKSRLPEDLINDLIRCHERGESIRKAARKLSLNRGTVRRYYRLLDEKGV